LIPNCTEFDWSEEILQSMTVFLDLVKLRTMVQFPEPSVSKDLLTQTIVQAEAGLAADEGRLPS
jgi:hypothetical protein